MTGIPYKKVLVEWWDILGGVSWTDIVELGLKEASLVTSIGFELPIENSQFYYMFMDSHDNEVANWNIIPKGCIKSITYT